MRVRRDNGKPLKKKNRILIFKSFTETVRVHGERMQQTVHGSEFAQKTRQKSRAAIGYGELKKYIDAYTNGRY